MTGASPPPPPPPFPPYKQKAMRGGKLRIQTAAFCLFMFTSLFYRRRRYCFSGATEKAKGGWKVMLCLCGNYDQLCLPLHLFSLSVHETSLLLLFLFFHRLTRPAPSPFFSFIIILFLLPPLCATRVVATDSNAWSIGRSWTSGGP